MSKYVIEVDPRLEKSYSDDSSCFGSDTTSLASSVKDNVYEHGRRYHGWREGKYAMPNDKEEQNRMDLQHHICLLALRGRLYKAPVIEKPQRVLDLGTGTGTWAIDFGDIYPEAQVIGIDLSPIQPKWVPPNVTFEVDDIEQAWTYERNSFDLIHIRQLCGFISDWPKLYKQALRILKPGGVLEIQDTLDLECDDGTLPKDSYMVKWNNLWREGIRNAGREILLKEHAAEMVAAGFEQVKYNSIKLPVGTWPIDKHEKEIGYYHRQHMVDGCESISLAVYTRFLGWSKDAFDALLYEVRQDLLNEKYHAYSIFNVTYGVKPLNSP